MNTKKKFEFALLSPPGHRSVRVVLAEPLRRDGAKAAASADVHWHGACLERNVPSRRKLNQHTRCLRKCATLRWEQAALRTLAYDEIQAGFRPRVWIIHRGL